MHEALISRVKILGPGLRSQGQAHGVGSGVSSVQFLGHGHQGLECGVEAAVLRDESKVRVFEGIRSGH